MRDGPVRRLLKVGARSLHRFDLATNRAWARWRGDRPYVLGGTCQRCAACCEEPSIQVGRLTWSAPKLRRLFLWWQRVVNGFELIRAERESRVFVFRCTHFDLASRQCDSYRSRPEMCRDYPRGLLAQANPEFLPGCGYRAIDPRAAAFGAAVDGLAMTEQDKVQLKRRLKLID